MAPDSKKQSPKSDCRQLVRVAKVILFVGAVLWNCVLGAAASSSPSTRNRGDFQRLESPIRKGFELAGGATRFELPIAGGSAWFERPNSGSSFRRLADVAVNSSSRYEVEALIAFKVAILADPLGALKSWRANDSEVCHWVGVKCSPQSPWYHRHVVELNLEGLELSGILASALQKIGNLPFLQQLDLSRNAFTGSIPAENSLVNCSNLSSLNISFNQLTGNIPFQLGDLVNLQSFDIVGNNLTGEIPASLGNCSSLSVLNLGTNKLSGVIPSALGKLSSLIILNLGSNSLFGSIPPALGNCSSLIRLEIPQNLDLSGIIPPKLSQITSLTHFILNACSFGGNFPSWIVNFTALNIFDLSYNNIKGEIPESIGLLSKLKRFYVYGNNITGVIPTSITNITSLTVLELGRNMVTGEIPTQIGSLGDMMQLGITQNSLKGVMPSSIGNLSNLQVLGLGYNPFMTTQTLPSWIGSLPNMILCHLPFMNLQGEIPVEIGKLANLQYLSLFNNNLKGSIPDSLQNCTSLSHLEIQWNQLNGTIPAGLGLLSQFTYILLDNNHLTGPFPGFISNFSQLQTFDVSTNALHGEIDNNIGKLSQLQGFHAGGNSFSGSFPEALTNCSALISIDIEANKLTGEIPFSLGNLTSLQLLYLGNNQFRGGIPTSLIVGAVHLGDIHLEFNLLEGAIPSEIGQLIFLRSLYLDRNNCSGTLPNSLGNCTSMMQLDLSSNNFEGSIPGASIAQMSSSLQYLNLSHNRFSGAWPSEFSTLAGIVTIDVSDNDILGSIPFGLGQCVALQTLDMSSNNLSGKIPPDLGSLKYLTFINASYNNFVGAIPDSGVFNLSNVTRASFLGEPLLCGGNLGACKSTPVTHNSPAHGCHGFKCEGIWIPTACAIIIIFIVAGMGLVYWVTFNRREKNSGDADDIIYHFKVTQDSVVLKKDVLRAIGLEAGDPNDNIIGVGSKSIVYKGISSQPGGKPFAVKLLTQHEEDGDEDNTRSESEIVKEVQILAGLRHRNILKVLSFFSAHSFGNEAIILEFMPQGSLHDHLHGGDNCDLSWETRFKIATGVAEGMVYLHHDCSTAIIHRDLKPTNILLDADFEPKVSDFGVSKLSGRTLDGDITTSTFCGTKGYIPPEHATETRVSTKGDVFSYGMVLLELLTRRRPATSETDGSHGDLRQWVMESFQDRPFELLDSTLQQEGTADPKSKGQMINVMRVALFCSAESPRTRPTMMDVVGVLRQIRDMGLEPVHYRTTIDLANDLSSSASEDSYQRSTVINA